METETTTETTEVAPLVYEPTAVINIQDYSSYPAKVVAKTASDLTGSVRSLEGYRKSYSILDGKKDKLRDYLFQWVEEDGEVDEHVTNIAEIFDIELTRTVTVTARVDFEFIVVLEIGEDLDTDWFNFEVSSNKYDPDCYEADVYSIDVSE